MTEVTELVSSKEMDKAHLTVTFYTVSPWRVEDGWAGIAYSVSLYLQG